MYSPPSSPARRAATMALPTLALVLVVASLLGNPALRGLLVAAWGRIDPRAVLVVLPVQLVAIVVCTVAQQALRPGISFAARATSTWIHWWSPVASANLLMRS